MRPTCKSESKWLFFLRGDQALGKTRLYKYLKRQIARARRRHNRSKEQ